MAGLLPHGSYHRLCTRGGDTGFGMICALHWYYVFNYFYIAVPIWQDYFLNEHQLTPVLIFFSDCRKIDNVKLLYLFQNRMYDYYNPFMFIHWL